MQNMLGVRQPNSLALFLNPFLKVRLSEVKWRDRTWHMESQSDTALTFLSVQPGEGDDVCAVLGHQGSICTYRCDFILMGYTM